MRVDWDRRRATDALARPSEDLTGIERNSIRNLAVSLHELGQIQRERGGAECVGAYRESLELFEHIGERAGVAVVAFNLGHAYKDLPPLRDLEQAEQWYRRSLELRAEGDRVGRGKGSYTLGHVVLERFDEARAADRPEEELLCHLNDAARFYHQALDLFPENAVNDLAVTHNALGATYYMAGDLDRALPHYNAAIQYFEKQDALFHAGGTRFNVALALAGASRFADARDYALAALRNFETYGDRAAADIANAKRLLAQIEQLRKQHGEGVS